jgi:hypothetical protein
MQVSCLDYSLTLKMEVKYSSETCADFQQTTRVISQKIELYITTTVEISDPTNSWMFSSV